MDSQNNISNATHNQFEIRKAGLVKPFLWLYKGWQDLLQRPSTSLAYGMTVSLMGAVILLFASNHIYIIAAAISGFMLAGPFVSIGLCEISRQQEHGQSLGFTDSLAALSANSIPLRNFSSTLLIISILWFILSGLVLIIFFGDIAPSIEDSLWGSFLDMVTVQQIFLYILVGGILASIVFVLSVVSIPAIIDGRATAMSAMSLSMQVVAANFLVMIVWAGLIFLLTAIGFLSCLLGMIVIFPLLGHATWHAYRDLVEVKSEGHSDT
jgi:uncharacterized membrane protein